MSNTTSNGNGPLHKGADGAMGSGGGAIDGVDGTETLANGATCNLMVPVQAGLAPVTGDYPLPTAITDQRPFLWNADRPAAAVYPRFASRLQQAGDLYRMPAYASGLLVASPCSNIPPIEITKGSELAPIITDRLTVLVVKDGKMKGSRIPPADLNCMLRSELFLGEFRPVDVVVKRPMYLGEEFHLTRPGYNDHGRGRRVFYVGDKPVVLSSMDATTRFLDAMAFASNADRTNAVAAALTVLLRNYWPGGKPAPIVTSSKSHGGKDTVVLFFSGSTPKVSISYEKADWALQKAFVAAVKFDAQLGVIVIENVRLDGGVREISSAFLERLITDPEPLLYSTGTGTPQQRPNDLVVPITTNAGNVSDDLLNRGLPIHLTPVGNVADRNSAIGNPKLEYLPANRERIEAELRGMIEKWKSTGMPLDTSVKHPFSEWAKVVGGILEENGFMDFLGNYGVRKTVEEPVRNALGHLGAFMHDEWLSATEWTPLVAHQGLTSILIPKADRESPESRRRGLGVVLSAHVEETFTVETDNEVVTLRLEKARRRFDGAQPETRYRFAVLERTLVPQD